VWLWLLSIVGVLHYYHLVPFFHLWFCKYWFWFLRFIFCWVTLPGTYAGRSALTWGKPASCSHLGFFCPFVVSFSPVGVSWISFVFFFPFFPFIASGAPSSLGSGSSPFFPVFTGFCFFSIMNRLFKRTVVLDGSGFAETVKVEDIASKVVEFFWQ